MAKTKRVSKAEKLQQAINEGVERALAKRGPSPVPSPSPGEPSAAERVAKQIAAVHEAARVARRGGAPGDVIDQLEAKAIELEKNARG